MLIPAVETVLIEVQPVCVRVRVVGGPFAGETWQIPKREYEQWAEAGPDECLVRRS